MTQATAERRFFHAKVVKRFQSGGPFGKSGITIVNDRRSARSLLKKLAKEGKRKRPVGVDTEFNKLATIQCWSVAIRRDEKRYDRYVIAGGLLKLFRRWLESDAPKAFQNYPADEEIFDHYKIKVAGLAGDTFVMDFLVDETDRKHGLKHAAFKWLKMRMLGNFKDVFSYVPAGRKKPVMYSWDEIWSDLDLQTLLVMYSADDPDATLRLFHHHKRVLVERKYWETYLTDDLPFTLTLTNVMKRGFPLNTERLRNIRTIVQIVTMRALHVFKAMVEEPKLNLRSVPQMKRLFFEKLKAPQVKQTKGERDKNADTATSLDGEVMRIYAEEYDLEPAAVLVDYRDNDKLKGTFLDGALNGSEYMPARDVVSDQGKVYTIPAGHFLFSDLNQIGAISGRISSRKYIDEVEETYTARDGTEATRIIKVKRGANLQNLPWQEPYGIKRGFVAMPGWTLPVVDMAGFEWWLMGHWSEDPVILQQNAGGYNPHGQTLTNLFEPCWCGWTLRSGRKHKKTSACRRVKMKDWKTAAPWYADLKATLGKFLYDMAKKFNFGLNYGALAKKAIKITGATDDVDEMQDLIDKHFGLYAGIPEYWEKQIELAKAEGCVFTISGRRVHLDYIDNNPKERYDPKRAHAENQAKNIPIQGSAANIINAIMNCYEHGMALWKSRVRGTLVDADPKKRMLVKESYERADYMRRRLCAEMLIQVHDEIVWHAPEEHGDECVEHAEFIMTNNRYMPRLRVKLPAEGHHGPNWMEAKG